VTCWRRLDEWQRAGVWDRLHALLLERLRAAGEIEWSRAIIDSSQVQAKKGLPNGPEPGRQRPSKFQAAPPRRRDRDPTALRARSVDSEQLVFPFRAHPVDIGGIARDFGLSVFGPAGDVAAARECIRSSLREIGSGRSALVHLQTADAGGRSDDVPSRSPSSTGGVVMPSYVVLINCSQQGIANFGHTLEGYRVPARTWPIRRHVQEHLLDDRSTRSCRRSRSARRRKRRRGDARHLESGGIRTNILRAFHEHEMEAVLAKAGSMAAALIAEDAG
jgi:hypothetical protein